MGTDGQTDDERPGQRGRNRILYSVDETPFFALWPVFGVQQTLMCVAGILSAPILIAQQLGVDDDADIRRQLLGISLFMCGIATILQNLIGCRIPIIQGANTSFIAPIAAILGLAKWSDGLAAHKLRLITPVSVGHPPCGVPGERIGPQYPNASENLIQTVNGTVVNEPWKLRMTEIQGNLMLASATQFLLGATGIVGFLLRFVGPITVAPTITVIGLYIGRYVLPLCEQHWGVSFMSLALLLIFVLFLSRFGVPFPTYSRNRKCHMEKKPIFILIPVVLAVGVSWLVAHILTITDALPSNSTMYGHKARTDYRLSAVYDSPWFSFPLPVAFGTPTISAAGYVGLLAGTLSSIIESTGDYFAAARVAEVVPPPPHAVNRGITMEGFSSVIGGLIGALCATTSYSENIGAIAVTRVASRCVFVTAGVILVIAGLVGKVAAVFTLIPDPIIGGVNLVTVGMVAAVGVSTLQYVDLKSTRNLVIIGVSMMLGLKIPDWMLANPGAIQSGNTDFDQVATVLLSTPMFMAGFIACLLDNLVSGTEKERGIKSWRETTNASDVFYISDEKTYELPFITEYIRKVKCCFYCPLSPTFHKEIDCCACCKGQSRDLEIDGTDNPAYQPSTKL